MCMWWVMKSALRLNDARCSIESIHTCMWWVMKSEIVLRLNDARCSMDSTHLCYEV